MLHLNSMKPVLFSAFCVSVLSLGCGEAPEMSVPGLPQQQQAIITSSSCPSSTVVCGSSTCPSGTHIASYGCYCGGLECGSTGASADGVKCVQNTEAFFVCGSTCPTGYTAYSNRLSYDCNTVVGSLGGSPQTLCANR